MRYLFFLLLLLPLMGFSQGRGDVLPDTVRIEGEGDSLYLVTRVEYENGGYAESREFVGDTATMKNLLLVSMIQGGPNGLPNIQQVAQGASMYLQRATALSVLSFFRPLFESLNGGEVYGVWASKYYASQLVGTYRLHGPAVPAPHNVRIYQLTTGPNVGALRAENLTNPQSPVNMVFTPYIAEHFRLTVGGQIREFWLVGLIQGRKLYSTIDAQYRLIQVPEN